MRVATAQNQAARFEVVEQHDEVARVDVKRRPKRLLAHRAFVAQRQQCAGLPGLEPDRRERRAVLARDRAPEAGEQKAGVLRKTLIEHCERLIRDISLHRKIVPHDG